jgi:hypothetical protein
MRKLLVLLLVLLAVPATAYSRTPPPPPPPPPQADGTLSIRDGRGMVQLSVRGSITGRFDRGRITITDPNPYDTNRPVVYGASKTIYRGGKTVIYQGRSIRFRLGGHLFHMRVEGRGIFLSAIGRGRGLIQGIGNVSAGIFYDGVWSLNDEPYHSLPDELAVFQLAALPVSR